jgi:hypothetical protein
MRHVAIAGNVPFDLVQSDDHLTAERLQEMAAQKEKQWQAILAKVCVVLLRWIMWGM